MVQLTFKQPANIDTQRNFVARVAADTPYLMTDYHVAHCVPRDAYAEASSYGAGGSIGSESLDGRSLVIQWLAGLGDTVAFAPALLALQQSNPGARIDVITIPALFDILTAAGFNGQMVEYPATVQTVERYDHFLPLEQIGRDADYFQLDGIDLYAKLLEQPQDLPTVKFSIDPAIREGMQLPPSPLIRVGIQVRGLSPIRTYPADLLALVLRGLVRSGYEVRLMGQAGDCPAPPAPPLLYNDCGRTTTFAETVALVEQMQVMICPDSYLMHLAGALAVPTVAIFSTMAPRLRVSRYPSVVPLSPDAPCAPCFVVEDDRCPIGHSECVALRSPNVAPPIILRAVESLAIQHLSSEETRPEWLGA